MGKASRDKGARGELEVVRMAIEHGLLAGRTAPLQAGAIGWPDVTLLSYPEFHVEVKRDERMSVDAMYKQAVADVLLRHGRMMQDVLPVQRLIPLVAWRRNSQVWRATLPLAEVFRLIKGQA